MSAVLVSRVRVALAALVCALLARASLAQADASLAGAAPTGASSPTAAAGRLLVFIEAEDGVVDVPALQASLRKELSREVEMTSDAASASVVIRLKNAARAKVSYLTPSGQQLTRDVELPPDRERSQQVLSWLTVNLVRDEASELLDALRARRKLEADARAAADKAAADKAAADKAAADKAAADKAAAEAARKKAAAAVQTKSDELLRERWKSFDVALATPLSLLRDSPKRELRVQLALGYGDSGAIRGAALSPGGLRIRQDLHGAAVGAGFVLVGGSARGALSSVGYAQIQDRLDGAVMGGGAARAGSLNGVMVAGGIAMLREPSRAILFSGGANVTGDVTGFALSGGANVTRDFRGIALAPINVQRRVSGLQLGVVNVADEVDGVALGVISIAKNGRVQPVVWGGTDRAAHLALKSIAGFAFGQFGGGIDFMGKRLSYEGGVGAHLRVGRVVFLEPGLHYSSTHELDGDSATLDRSYLHYLLLAGFRAGNKLDLLLGGGVRHTLRGDAGESTFIPEVRGGIGFF